MLILAERDNTFWRLRPLRPPWGHLGSPCLPDASQIPPRCIPDVSQIPPSCLPDASQMSSRDASRCFQMLPSASRCLPHDASPMMPPQWCLLHGASSMYSLKTSVWGLTLGSFASVTKKAITLHRTRISDTLRTHCYSYAFFVLIHCC